MQPGPLAPGGKSETSEICNNKQKGGRLIAVTAVLLILLLAAFAAWVLIYSRSPCSQLSSGPLRVYIPPQTSLPQIQKILVDAQVLEDDFRFWLLARYLGVSTRLKAGEYLFTPEHTPLLVLKDMAEGKTIPRSLTIAEGLNMYQVAQKIEDGGWGAKADVLLLMYNSEFLAEQEIKANSLEGHLFPDTYFFERSDSPQHILSAMVKRMQGVFSEECGQAKSLPGIVFDCGGQDLHAVAEEKSVGKAAVLKLSMNDVLTLASIVEKETGYKHERPLVAKVFLNRLRKGMRLQADPTVVYGLKKFKTPLSRKDLRTPTSYNTYTRKGLPSGPICNPGQASIAAVFHPAEENYYYFVLQGDGEHFFSKSLKEHNQAVARLRKSEKNN